MCVRSPITLLEIIEFSMSVSLAIDAYGPTTEFTTLTLFPIATGCIITESTISYFPLLFSFSSSKTWFVSSRDSACPQSYQLETVKVLNLLLRFIISCIASVNWYSPRVLILFSSIQSSTWNNIGVSSIKYTPAIPRFEAGLAGFSSRCFIHGDSGSSSTIPYFCGSSTSLTPIEPEHWPLFLCCL